MAAVVHRMFGCPVCGYRIDETEPVCPRCNNKFDSRTKLECPFCGELVDPNVRQCPVCHVDYLDFKERTKTRGSDSNIDSLLNEIIKLESVQSKEKPKKFSCPNCSWLLDGSETKCPKCGKDLDEDYAFQCPICGSPVPPHSTICPECGATFEEEPEEEPSPVAEPEPAPDPEPPPTPKPDLKELEELAASVRTKPPEPSPPAPEAPREPSPEEPETLIPEPVQEPPVQIAPEEEPRVETATEEVVQVKAPATKKKRKLKAKPGNIPQR